MNNKKVLAGAKLAGGNPENGRVEIRLPQSHWL
jgi:hypothetical protein